MIMIVDPNPGDRFATVSASLGVHVPTTTSSMLGLGGWGVTKNHMAEAKLSLQEKFNLNHEQSWMIVTYQVVATKSGFSNRTLAFP